MSGNNESTRLLWAQTVMCKADLVVGSAPDTFHPAISCHLHELVSAALVFQYLVYYCSAFSLHHLLHCLCSHATTTTTAHQATARRPSLGCRIPVRVLRACRGVDIAGSQYRPDRPRSNMGGELARESEFVGFGLPEMRSFVILLLTSST